jgi:hypothetical protein
VYENVAPEPAAAGPPAAQDFGARFPASIKSRERASALEAVKPN